MKLDNRPRKLLIKGVPVNDEAVQLVRNHYQVGWSSISLMELISLHCAFNQNMGNLESFWTQGDGEVVAQFWSRSAAEHVRLSPCHLLYVLMYDLRLLRIHRT